MEQGVRKHDEFYANEDRSREIKHTFRCIIDLIANRLTDLDRKSLLDIGCASGDFLYAVRDLLNIPSENLEGADLLDTLLKAARDKLPEIAFHKKDVAAPSFQMHSKYDVVTLIGVLQIFDDYDTALNNCIECCRSGGVVIVSGPFNPLPIDMLTRYRRVNENEQGRQPLELGWNIFSQQGLGIFLSRHERVKSYEFHDIEFPENVVVEKREDDLLRSWTMDVMGHKKFINGNQIIQHHSILEIQVH